jgi:hypothetical protein
MPFCQRFSGWFAFSGLNFAKIKWKTWKIAVLFGRDCAGLKVKGAENFHYFLNASKMNSLKRDF